MTADLPFPSPTPAPPAPVAPPSTVGRIVATQLGLVVGALAGTAGAAVVALVLWLTVGPCGPGQTTTVAHLLVLKGGLTLAGMIWAAVPALAALVSWRTAHPGPALRVLAGAWAGVAVLTLAVTLVIVVRAEPSPLCL